MRKQFLLNFEDQCKNSLDPVTCLIKHLYKQGVEKGEIIEIIKNKYNISFEEARIIVEKTVTE